MLERDIVVAGKIQCLMRVHRSTYVAQYADRNVEDLGATRR